MPAVAESTGEGAGRAAADGDPTALADDDCALCVVDLADEPQPLIMSTAISANVHLRMFTVSFPSCRCL